MCPKLQYGIFERCKEILDGGYDVNIRDEENVTLLHWAAINNRKELINLYISNGAQVDAIGGKLLATPLHWAVRYINCYSPVTICVLLVLF